MRTYLLQDEFNLYRFTSDKWPHPVHKHTYFEIIFIINGSGTHHLNGLSLKYGKGDVFFLGHDDYHEFEIAATTEFCYVRFTRSSLVFLSEDKYRGTPMASLIQDSAPGFMVTSEAGKKTLHRLLNVIYMEYQQKHLPDYVFLRDGIMMAMLSVLARASNYPVLINQQPQYSVITKIIDYIGMHIRTPEKLSISNLALRFSYAPTYLGILFRQRTGQSLKQFIIKTRLQLIETRLLYSNDSLSCLADEFGYTDESHLCKQFKKYKGITPMEFRISV